MTVKRLLLLIASFLFLLLDLPIVAQDKSKPASDSPPQVSASKPLEKRATEDVAYIIHPEERRAFLRLESAEEREKFIEQFWLRRDPTPGTIENEFKEEHYRRIAYANEHYASGIPGWETDRGRIYITFGPPDEIESRPSGTPASRFPMEQWLYRYIEEIGQDVLFEFLGAAKPGEYRCSSCTACPKPSPGNRPCERKLCPGNCEVKWVASPR